MELDATHPRRTAAAAAGNAERGGRAGALDGSGVHASSATALASESNGSGDAYSYSTSEEEATALTLEASGSAGCGLTLSSQQAASDPRRVSTSGKGRDSPGGITRTPSPSSRSPPLVDANLEDAASRPGGLAGGAQLGGAGRRDALEGVHVGVPGETQLERDRSVVVDFDYRP